MKIVIRVYQEPVTGQALVTLGLIKYIIPVKI